MQELARVQAEATEEARIQAVLDETACVHAEFEEATGSQSPDVILATSAVTDGYLTLDAILSTLISVANNPWSYL